MFFIYLGLQTAPKLKGGIGNQLFQYALGRCLAYKNNTELKLDLTSYEKSNDNHHSFYRLDEFNIEEHFATIDEIKAANFVEEKDFGKEHGAFAFEVLDYPDNTRLCGLWQSEKYFIEIADIISRDLTLRNSLGRNSSKWKEKILSSNCAVSLHVRHGDYLSPQWRELGIIPVDYYIECINKLLKTYHELTIFVFSDDIQWCKDNFQFDIDIEFVENCESDVDEIFLMSFCKHNIIANSTFSWWGAWLNQNPGKNVFAPNPWMANLHWKDIVPEYWIKIPVDYTQNILPILSIIIYIQNNVSLLRFSLSNIVQQNFAHYEIIFIDASTDGSGELCRQLAMYDKVTVLKVESSTGKFTAWNKGLDVARGDYVLFLTSQNFIFPNSCSLLATTCEETLSKGKIGNKNYVITANIINSTQYLEEVKDGNLNIDVIPNKKFSLKIDDAFKNLDTAVNLNLSNEEKLTVLSILAINRELGTKFFKRSFINKHHIRFNESDTTDAELLFIVNAFMCTEKITFVPQVFYGRFK